jgi:chemotaxis protein histidine kinase CheA
LTFTVPSELLESLDAAVEHMAGIDNDEEDVQEIADNLAVLHQTLSEAASPPAKATAAEVKKKAAKRERRKRARASRSEAKRLAALPLPELKDEFTKKKLLQTASLTRPEQASAQKGVTPKLKSLSPSQLRRLARRKAARNAKASSPHRPPENIFRAAVTGKKFSAFLAGVRNSRRPLHQGNKVILVSLVYAVTLGLRPMLGLLFRAVFDGES